MIISRSLLLVTRNVSDISCSNKTHIFSITFSRKSCRLWENVGKYGTAIQATDNIIWSMRLACWIPKATDTSPEYVIRISFLQQQWLYERTSLLRYTYNACLHAVLFWELSASVKLTASSLNHRGPYNRVKPVFSSETITNHDQHTDLWLSNNYSILKYRYSSTFIYIFNIEIKIQHV
jgi:hypothetical protein